MADGVLVRAPNWLGDAVMCTPALSLLRERFPHARITVAARGGLAAVFEANPDVDARVSLPEGPPWRVARSLRGNWSMAVLLTNSLRSALEMALAGVRAWGYAGELRRPLLAGCVPRPEEDGPLHQVEYYRGLVAALPGGRTVEPGPARLRWVVTGREAAEARAMLAGASGAAGLVAVCPSAAFGPAKMWPTERFREAIGRLGAAGLGVVLVGAPSDAAAVAELARTEGVVDLVGRTSLRQLGAVLSLCDAFVGNDSGAMHVAAAVGTPVVAVFGSTDPRRTGPLAESAAVLWKRVPCSPCYRRRCPYGSYRCLRAVETREVVEAALAAAGLRPRAGGVIL